MKKPTPPDREWRISVIGAKVKYVGRDTERFRERWR
jgi:hypothetical protein